MAAAELTVQPAFGPPSRVLISATPEHLMRDAAAAIAIACADAVAERGAFHWALSGGSTPVALFRLMATPEIAPGMEWGAVHAWWGDERDVPSDHAESNYRAANDALLARVPIPAANVHRVRTEDGADRAAAAYEADIRAALGDATAFDLVLLGLGDDGHTASLFPGTVGALPPEALVAAHFVPKVGMRRVTFTPRLINAARRVAFLVSGAGKAEVLRRVLRGPSAPDELPSQLIRPDAGELTWWVDAAAAGRL